MLKTRVPCLFAVILLFHFLRDTSQAQHSNAMAESLLTVGRTLIVQGDSKGAKKAFKAVLENKKEILAAYVELGKLAIAEEKWGKARKYFEKILKKDPANIEAHYYLGICLREIGNARGEFLQGLFFSKYWQKSQEHFQWVLEHDSLYQEVPYQYARLLENQKKFIEAITLGQAQIRLRPDLVEPFIGLLHFYRSFIYHGGLEKAMHWLEIQPWALAHYFKGEILRRQGEFAQADSIFRALLSQQFLQMPVQLIHLSRVRILYAEYRPQEAEKYYWEAVNGIDNQLAADLVFNDIKYIVTDKELEIYQALHSLSQKKVFFYNFWAGRNPGTSSDYNTRLAEHYRRLRYAEQHYEFYGDRSFINNPDKLNYLDFPNSYSLNHEYNDEGLIYIRQGPPDEWEISHGEDDFFVNKTKSWRYLKSSDNPEMIFHFTVDAGDAGNNWRLTPHILSRQHLFSQVDWDTDNYYLLNEPNWGQRYTLELENIEDSHDYVLLGLSTDRHTNFEYDVEIYLAPAESLFVIGDLENAKIFYHKALKLYKNLLRAKSGLGKIAILERKWRKANQYFEDILRREPENFEAHYYRGICFRELGVSQAAIARKSTWRKAKENFQWIMERDSLYKDVVYQFALLQRYRGNYTRAIELGYNQIRLRPDLVKPQVGLYYLYWSLLKEEKEKKAMAWLHKQTRDHAQYFIGEHFRRQNNLKKANSIFQHLLARDLSMSRQPIYLSLMRIEYARNNPNQAEAIFKKALKEVRSHLDADLIFEDIKYLVSDQDLVTYQLLDSVPQKVDFLSTFWLQRDPVPSAPYNARLVEHYRRMRFAEEHYEIDNLRDLSIPPDLWQRVDFPRIYGLNKRFSDQGLIYIRYGEPDERIVTAGPEVVSNETWFYYATATSPELVFHFEKPPMARGNKLRLSPYITNPKMLEDLFHLDPNYYRLYNEENPGEQFVVAEELADKNRKSIALAFTTDRHTWEEDIKPLDIRFYTATFRGDHGKTDLEVYYGLPIHEIVKKMPENKTEIHLENGLAIHDINWQPIDKQVKISIIPFNRQDTKKNDLFLDLFRTTVTPDSYHVAIHARPHNADLLATSHGLRVNVPDYSTSELALSDILLASSITPTERTGKFIRNGLQIVPNPLRVFSLEKQIYIYFEIYNLELDAEGKTAFTIEYTVSLANKRRTPLNLFGLFGERRKSSMTIQSDRVGNSSFSSEYIAIDVSNLEEGEYKFTVKVTDKQTGESAVKENQIILY